MDASQGPTAPDFGSGETYPQAKWKVSAAPVFILPQLRIAINGTEMRLSPMSKLASKEQAAIIGEALKYIQTRKKTTGSIACRQGSRRGAGGLRRSTGHGDRSIGDHLIHFP
ncbi:MAG TPA: hypothetical protein VK852_05025, partial [Desulfobacterales bacterium]|nr:hypothetical protein [Desulfobacterales bacterium]